WTTQRGLIISRPKLYHPAEGFMSVTPEPIMKIAMGFMAAKYLFAATEIGVFDVLAYQVRLRGGCTHISGQRWLSCQLGTTGPTHRCPVSGQSGRAADISGMSAFDPKRT